MSTPKTTPTQNLARAVATMRRLQESFEHINKLCIDERVTPHLLAQRDSLQNQKIEAEREVDELLDSDPHAGQQATLEM